MDDSRVKDISSLLSAFFDADKIRKGGKYADFFRSWNQIVGERLAAHSRVSELENGLLIIEAEHPGWIQLLQLRQAEILETVARRFPELDLRGILFRLASGAKESPEKVEPRPGPFGPGGSEPQTPEEAMRAPSNASLDSIDNEDLRQSLKRLKAAVDQEQNRQP